MTDNINEVRESVAKLAGCGFMHMHDSDALLALLADHARLERGNVELTAAVRGLLNALPSATTHPAIAAARKAVRND